MDKEINIGGKKIFYRIPGNGRPVMLVHGFGETGDVWANQVASLQDKFKLIVPDLPGSGQSEMSDDMSMEGMAEILKAILDIEIPASSGKGRPCMIGHSMGGYITLAFVEKYAAYLKTWGLFHSSAFADSEEKKATRRKGIAFIREHGAHEFLKTSTPNLFSPETRQEDPQLVEQFIESLRGFSADALVAYYEAMIARPDRTILLKNVETPILFVMGEHDVAVPLPDGLKQCHLPLQAHIHILRRSGHMGMLEEKERSLAILSQFLNSL